MKVMSKRPAKAVGEMHDMVSGGIQQLLSRVSAIEQRVDSLDQANAFSARLNEAAYQEIVHRIFGKGTQKRKAQAYLAANGSRSVQEIAEHLDMKRQNVAPLLRSLQDERLVDVTPDGARDHWRKLAVDGTFSITKILMAKFSLDRDGLPVKVKASRARPQARKTRR